MNCVLYPKNSDKVSFFIKDCMRSKSDSSGFDYIGSDMKMYGIKPDVWSILWTLQEAQIGDHISSVIEAPVFNGQFAGSRENVDAITQNRIRAEYSLEDELKMLRVESGPDVAAYKARVAILVAEGQAFKNQHFPKSEVE